MSLMNALTSGASIAPTGEGGEVKLGADAETLALFAQLFAMIQAPAETAEAGADTAGGAQGPIKGITPGRPDAEPLPAAAMLMAAHGIGPVPAIEDVEVDDEATRLTKLLVAAGALLAPHSEQETGSELRPAAISGAPAADAADAMEDAVAAALPSAETGDPRPMTATEMLTNAIEILRRLDEPSHVGAVAEKSGAAHMAAAPPATAPAVQVTSDGHAVPVVILPPTPDFVGPMPVVLPSAKPVMAPPSADFVGPMPVNPGKPVAPAPPSAEFVGPMPAGPAMPVSQPAALAPPSPEFVGPMPAMPVAVGATMAASAPDIARPTPSLANAGQASGGLGMLLPPSPAFVGPMPAVPLSGETASPATMAPVSLAAGLFENIEESGPELRQVMPEAKAGRRDIGQRDGLGRTGLPQQAVPAGPMIENVSTAALRRALTGYDAPSTGAGQQAATQSQSQQSGGMSNGQSTALAAAQTMSAASGGHSGGQQGGHGGGAQSAAQQFVDAGGSQDSAGRTMLYRLNTANAGWTDTMVRRLTSDLQSGVQTVRIILEPRQLGRLNVELGLRNGQASIRIAAESAEAAKLLSGARGQLGSMLESAGLRLAGFQTAGTGGDMAGDSGHSHDGKAGGENAGGNKEFSNKMAAAQMQADDADAAGAPPETSLRDGETAVLSILA